jgi:hypothetical protein
VTRIQPSFLICSERSGSNLIRSLLHAHPEVYAPEPIHLAAFWERLDEFGDLGDDTRWRALLTAIVEFLDSWKGKLNPTLAFDVDQLSAAVPEREFAALYTHIYARGLAASGKRRLFIKENHTAQRADLLLAHWPAARFVWQVRDPRDFLASCKQFPAFKYGSAVDAVRVWSADQDAALDLVERLGEARVLSTTYESLIHAPEPHLRRVCAFLELDYAPEMLDFYKTEDARRASAHDAWRNLGKPIIPNNSGRYKDALSAAEIALVEELAGPLMERLGYASASEASDRPRAEFPAAAGLAPHLRRVDDASGSAVVHRIIDRYVGAPRQVS